MGEEWKGRRGKMQMDSNIMDEDRGRIYIVYLRDLYVEGFKIGWSEGKGRRDKAK